MNADQWDVQVSRWSPRHQRSSIDAVASQASRNLVSHAAAYAAAVSSDHCKKDCKRAAAKGISGLVCKSLDHDLRVSSVVQSLFLVLHWLVRTWSE
jgi:hypothetical protein